MSIVLMMIMLFSVVAKTQVQESDWPINEEGKSSFHEEVLFQERDQKELWLNAIRYSEKVKKAGMRSSAKPQVEKNIIRQEGSFFVYKRGLFTPQIHGEIIFQIKIEIKPNGYTYTFSDFVFQFYEKNRYGQFAPVRGKYKPLEEEKYSGMQEAWDEYKGLTTEVVKNHIRVLKKEMEKVSAAACLDRNKEPVELN